MTLTGGREYNSSMSEHLVRAMVAYLTIVPLVGCGGPNADQTSRTASAASTLRESGADVQLFTRTIRPFCHVDLSRAEAPDQLLPLLSDLPPVQQLDAGSPGITDAGAAHILALSQLQTLNLKGSGTTDGGITRLAELKSLTNLYLPVGISDKAKQRLQAALPNLEIHDELGRWPRVPDDPSNNTEKMVEVE